jgi:hypothetical protein
MGTCAMICVLNVSKGPCVEGLVARPVVLLGGGGKLWES